MTDINITLPVQRHSPLYIPRRDLVLAASDSLSLLVTLVESDDPSAPPATLPGASATMTVWHDPWPGWGGSWDYSRCWCPGGVLWAASEPVTTPGSVVEFFLPLGALSGLPLRTLWALEVGFSGTSTMVSQGRLHLTSSMVSATGADVGTPLILDDPAAGAMDNQYWVA